MTDEPVMFEKELDTDTLFDNPNEAFYVEKDDIGVYVVSGPRIDRMLGYTNLESERGFDFFQKFLKDSGILAELEEAGIEEGDTVRMYGLEFDFYKLMTFTIFQTQKSTLDLSLNFNRR